MEQLRNMTDDELLAIIAEGREECFKLLIERYEKRLMAYIRRNTQRLADAEDIYQESLMRVMLSIRANKYNPEGRFISWVIRIAHNLIADNYRRNKNCMVLCDSDFDYDIWNKVEMNVASNQVSRETEIVYQQMLDEVKLMLKTLPACQQQVLTMRHYYDMSFKEIADETNVSINTALGRERYAIANLRKLMCACG